MKKEDIQTKIDVLLNVNELGDIKEFYVNLLTIIEAHRD